MYAPCYLEEHAEAYPCHVHVDIYTHMYTIYVHAEFKKNEW